VFQSRPRLALRTSPSRLGPKNCGTSAASFSAAAGSATCLVPGGGQGREIACGSQSIATRTSACRCPSTVAVHAERFLETEDREHEEDEGAEAEPPRHAAEKEKPDQPRRTASSTTAIVSKALEIAFQLRLEGGQWRGRRRRGPRRWPETTGDCPVRPVKG